MDDERSVVTDRGAAERKPRLVVVVPCYNEARRLDERAFLRYVDRHPAVSLLFVDDGSRDDTGAVLARLCAAAPSRARFLALETNQGKAEAVRRGLLAALETDPDLVAFWDADLATSLDEIERFLKVFRTTPGLEIVIGARVKLMGRQIERKRWRHYAGRVFATTVSALLRLPVYDTQCGAKMFRAGPGLRQVLARPFETRWLFDVEVLARYIELHPEGQRGVERCVYELPVDAWRDVEATSLTPRAYARAALSAARLITAYGVRLRRASRRRPSPDQVDDRSAKRTAAGRSVAGDRVRG